MLSCQDIWEATLDVHQYTYKSLPPCMPNLPPHAKSQITAIMCVKEPNIVLEFMQVQEQHGYCDCSIFAISFTTSVCLTQSSWKYIHTALVIGPPNSMFRGFIEFLYLHWKTKTGQLCNWVLVPVYCKCRQPESGKMLYCHQCQD